MKPIFCRLSKRDLLEKCLLGATQNQNESFNSTIWNRCPKTEFSSTGTINTAVNLAVITFNDGMVGLHPVLRFIGGETSSLAIQFLRAQDATRVKRAQDKEEEVSFPRASFTLFFITFSLRTFYGFLKIRKFFCLSRVCVFSFSRFLGLA